MTSEQVKVESPTEKGWPTLSDHMIQTANRLAGYMGAMFVPHNQTAPDDLVRKPEREYWLDIPVIAYHWEEPSGLPPSSSQTLPKVAYHWSTGPKDAERLIRLSDVATRIKELTAEVERVTGRWIGAERVCDSIDGQRREAEARAAKAEEALRKCRHQFTFYAEEHHKAGKEGKAATNQHFADICSEALGEGKA